MKNRTGQAALSVLGGMFEHSLRQGFPLLTTKRVPFKTVAVELEFFIKGLTDKRWLQARNCHIWDEWCNPQKVAHIANPSQKKLAQLNENDLGPVYGKQWRSFSANSPQTPNVDQLAALVTKLKKDPHNRQLVVSAWNPLQLEAMALPPCHVLFHVNVIANHISLTWFQRSADLMLGVPFNIASYALLLHLLAKECKLTEGKLLGMFSNLHIYEDHLSAAKAQLKRSPKKLPTIATPTFTSIFDWEHSHTHVQNYCHHPKINLNVAV